MLIKATETNSKEEFANLCCVIGSPIIQSKSPILHNEAYKILGIDQEFYYYKEEVSEQDLPQFMEKFKRNIRCKGVSVTMPLKKEVIKYLDNVDALAKNCDAVNTIIKTDEGQLSGYNTDVTGIINSLKNNKKDVSKVQNGVILGSGATARSAFEALKAMGLKNIYVASRSEPDGNLKSAKWIKLNDILDTEKYLSLFNSESTCFVSTLPWDAAKKVIDSLNQCYSIFFHEAIVLECAFPTVLETSISGVFMLVYQAIEQIKLMTAGCQNIKQWSADLEKDVYNAMTNAIC